MKIAVACEEADRLSRVDQHFGRCPYFGIFSTDSGTYEFVANRAQQSSGGAGIQTAQLLADNGVSKVLTGNVGPKAFQALEAAKIEIFSGVEGTVAEAVDKLLRGEYEQSDQGKVVPPHFGLE
jgi:predicted Fe-Mo cluster-binding NifX family protein